MVPLLEDVSASDWPDLPIDERPRSHILLLDPDADYRVFLESILSKWGYEVTSTDSPEAAIRHFEANHPDLVVMDINLPADEGTRTVARLKALQHPDPTNPLASAHGPFVPIILHTIPTTHTGVIDGFRAGADDFITKPANVQEIEVRLQSMLRFKHMHDLLRQRESQLRSMNVKLELEANTDALTGLANRRAFDLALAEATLPTSLLIADLDHFKEVNDTYGHPAGDDLLRQIADILGRLAPAGATVARWGGEEFAILLPGTSSNVARTLAEHIRTQVMETSFILSPSVKLTRTLSLGLTTVDASCAPETFIAQADAALYHSKRQGRNQATHHKDLPPTQDAL